MVALPCETVTMNHGNFHTAPLLLKSSLQDIRRQSQALGDLQRACAGKLCRKGCRHLPARPRAAIPQRRSPSGKYARGAREGLQRHPGASGVKGRANWHRAQFLLVRAAAGGLAPAVVRPVAVLRAQRLVGQPARAGLSFKRLVFQQAFQVGVVFIIGCVVG